MALLMLVALVLLWGSVLSEELYFNQYGHCNKMEPFDLTSENYELGAMGGGFHHENMNCQLMFRAPPEKGVCISFKSFYIEDCGVSLIVYRGKSKNDEEIWKRFSCDDKSPNQMCTSDQYVSLRVQKQRLNQNTGYSFRIFVEKSTSPTEGGVLVASIGVVIGIIIAVVVVLALLALLVLYCCRRQKQSSAPQGQDGAGFPCKGMPLDGGHTQPSAPPPPPEMHHPMLAPEGSLYPTFHEPPPPYTEI